MIEPIFHTKVEAHSEQHATITFEPLHLSFANSLGNAIRRTLLSSLPGYAISHVKIEGASQLFATLPGIKESVLDMVLNLKKLKFAANGEGPFTVRLEVSGPQKVIAKNFEGEAEIVNGDVYIAEITENKVTFQVEAIVEKGYGFVASEDRESKAGYITLDTSFSPVQRVNYKVEEARVGRKSNFERLIMDIWTDGSLSPKEAIQAGVKNLNSYLTHIFSGRDTASDISDEAIAEKSNEAAQTKQYDIIIDELNLPSRVINALLRENIETVGDLVERGKENLVGLKGVGRKSIDLVEDELKKMGISL